MGSNPTAAVVSYTKALIEHPTSPDYYTQRSIAFTRSKPPRHDLALQDAEYAVLCGQKRGKRDKIQAGQQRRVVAYYNMSQYANAKLVLDAMKRWRPENSKPQQMEHDMWSAKIDKKLATDQQEATTAEYPTQTLPSESAVVKALRNQIKADGTYNYGGEDVEVPDATSATQQSEQQAPPNQQPATTSTAIPQKIRHEWYQNNQNVIITIYAKGVAKDKVETDIQDDSVSISFPQPADMSTSFDFNLDPLFALIDATNSKATVMSTKIELTLRKQQQGQKWGALEGTEILKQVEQETGDGATKKTIMATVSQPQTSTTAPSYPTSSKSGPKNWDKLADDLTAKKKKKKDKKTDGSDSEDESGVESDTGGDPVDGFFKKLYAGSDDDTRRAMMKSFQESNGTALSTNWAEVGSKKVEEVKSKDDN